MERVALDMQAPCMQESALVQAPLAALSARLQELLEEWPDHPLLGQLAAITGRVLSLPINSPLKAILTGLELLLSQAQVWEESAAKHVSLAPLLGQVAALAQRWRKLELESWEHMLDTAARKHANGARLSWFHLFRILIVDTSEGGTAEAGVLAEQFLQTSTIGEFGARMSMLEAFRQHLVVLGRGEDAEEAGRRAGAGRRRLADTVANVVAYYRQFQPAVDSRVAAHREPLEKDLRDFVKLAKWEDRGYYSMKQSAERAQRKLHKICRRYEDALRQPAARVIASASLKMGLADLSGRELAQDSPVETASGGVVEQQGGDRHQRFLSECCELAEAPFAAPPVAAVASALRISERGLYQNRLGQLLRRLDGVVGQVLWPERAGSLPPGTLEVDDLAGTIAARAAELRGVSGKGARSVKKKALTDMLRALGEVGLSRHRRAVPADDREVSAWFRLPLPAEGAQTAEGYYLAEWASSKEGARGGGGAVGAG